ncbi:MAG: GNAT family N-acetyltransferase [Cystobacterineae bacterium]|nr:GNAT family N-acetyltransferase [Cystobacterineae bacterium]
MNVQIRPWKTEDASDLVEVINNKKIQDNLRDGIPYPYMHKDAEDFIRTTLGADKDKSYAFAIEYDFKAIGCIGILRQGNIHRLSGELGYYIAEPYWGKGLMTEAIGQMCAYIFEHTDIIRIFAQPFDLNHASCRVLEKTGFQLEGILRKNAIKNGEVVDMRSYALIRPSMKTAGREKRLASGEKPC